jgi:ubiquitin-protein ligase
MYSSAVAKNPIEGVYVVVSANDPLIWFGVVIVRTGIFYGGIFRFTVSIQKDFPDNDQVPVSSVCSQ